jgi:hypothetical protein
MRLSAGIVVCVAAVVALTLFQADVAIVSVADSTTPLAASSLALSSPPTILTAPVDDEAQTFGSAVAVSGSRALVSADCVGGWGVCVFVHVDGEWTLEATLEPVPNKAVALSGDRAVVGGGNSAEVYVRSGTVWSKEQELKADPASDWLDGVGSAVAISGDTIAVGAPVGTMLAQRAGERRSAFASRRRPPDRGTSWPVPRPIESTSLGTSATGKPTISTTYSCSRRGDYSRFVRCVDE